MLKSDLVQTDKHSIKILLRRKNLRFLRRTNHIQNLNQAKNQRYKQYIWFLPTQKQQLNNQKCYFLPSLNKMRKTVN